ncbi:hypothetical protein BC941DRAFT_480492 [Chlamydoabsidia padenii]|nr:hypothetical protein BC941DRAFT_480492 [Chlamydoabsidia padenii]
MYIEGVPRLKAANELRWYLAKDVLDYLHQLRLSLFQTASTNYSTNYLPQLELDGTANQPLFNSDKRFPDTIVCICEGIGEWNTRLQEIQHLTSIMTRHQQIPRGYQHIGSLGNVELLLLRQINECLMAYEAAESFVDRNRFEDRYGLVWEDS